VRQVFLAASRSRGHGGLPHAGAGPVDRFRDGTWWTRFVSRALSLVISAPEDAGLPHGAVMPVLDVDDLEEAVTAGLTAGARPRERRDRAVTANGRR
jgi:hypothetical protein